MKSRRHLLIDGHNLLHAWPVSRRLMRASMESARAHLVSAGLVIHDTEHIRVTIVFDGNAESIRMEDAAGSSACSIVFAPASMTADDLIEQLIGASDEPGLFLVATGDRPERETVEALGAETISPDNLRLWVERCQARQAARVSRRSKENDLSNRLPL